jgi:hypothetical protein
MVLCTSDSHLQSYLLESRDQEDLGLKPGLGNCKNLSQKYKTQTRAVGVARVEEDLPKKCESLESNPSTTKKMVNGGHTEQTHVTLEPTVVPVWWDSVLNLSNIYSSAL